MSNSIHNHFFIEIISEADFEPLPEFPFVLELSLLVAVEDEEAEEAS